jgi:preprotein translocase subunit SecE
MNRQAKRMMQKQKAAPQDRAQTVKDRRAVVEAAQRRKRVPLRTFLKEVRQELRKVNWPTRPEVMAYTIVVVVAVVVMTSLVFGLDTAFGKAILNVLHAQ